MSTEDLLQKALELGDRQADARILGLSEDEIAKIDADAEAAVDRTIAQEITQVWQALEAELPRQEFLEIKNFIDGLRR
jgi:hypothetical protein